jgi:dihydrofolate synthase / folylpolyglutamate synthase
MDYNEIVQYMYNQLPMFQRIGKAAYKANLDNTLALDSYFKHPHQQYKTIHIAGTNGKGSVSHTLASILQEAGCKTGLYTSPHLRDFRERIKIDGQQIPESFLIDFIVDHKFLFEDIKPSFFEITVALAFQYFAKENIDVAIVETGLGGRLDSTNIISPELSIITNISKDHTDLLGDTLEKIAGEKAGIIKKNIPVVIGETHVETFPVFVSKANEMHATVIQADHEYSCSHSHLTPDGRQIFEIQRSGQLVYENLHTDLLGFYQRKNICTVLSAVDELRKRGFVIPEEAVYKGIANTVANTGLLGRWQILDFEPLIVCDTGHNEDGIRQVMAQISATPHQNLHIVFGVVKDKDVSTILALLPKTAKYYFTRANIPRALGELELMNLAKAFGLKGNAYYNVQAALTAAKDAADANDMIYIGGSTFVVAEAI